MQSFWGKRKARIFLKVSRGQEQRREGGGRGREEEGEPEDAVLRKLEGVLESWTGAGPVSNLNLTILMNGGKARDFTTILDPRVLVIYSSLTFWRPVSVEGDFAPQ